MARHQSVLAQSNGTGGGGHHSNSSNSNQKKTATTLLTGSSRCWPVWRRGCGRGRSSTCTAGEGAGAPALWAPACWPACTAWAPRRHWTACSAPTPLGRTPIVSSSRRVSTGQRQQCTFASLASHKWVALEVQRNCSNTQPKWMGAGESCCNCGTYIVCGRLVQLYI